MSEKNNTLKNTNTVSGRFESLIKTSKRELSHFPKKTSDQELIIISIADQRLYLTNNYKLIESYIISSAEAGTGNFSGSFQTPLGLHKIFEKFGDNAEKSSIFKARKNTLNIAEVLIDPKTRSNTDNITSRILWLEGLEEGINKGKDKYGNNVDSHSRFIYIHGTDEEGRLGKTASHGCIRMANQDVIQLYNLVEIGCLVLILED